MTSTLFLKAFTAWLDRWSFNDEQAATRLSPYRKVTAEQVRALREGRICPKAETVEVWSVEINSAPGDKKVRGSDEGFEFLKGMFGMKG